MKKIAFLKLADWQKKIITKNLKASEVYFIDEPEKDFKSSAAKHFEVLSVFVDFQVTKQVIQNLPVLKFITTRSTGFDHIDLEECKNRKILVSSVPSYGSNTVAEFAFGLILNLTRKIYQAVDQIKQSGSFTLDNLKGVDLNGKTLGVVGGGRIGQNVIKIAKGFGMNVVVFDPLPQKNLEKKLMFRYCNLNELLKISNIISIHCPYNQSTYHLINKKNIRLVRKGAYLINTARGGIVSTDALLWGLRKGILAGAGLDVLEEETETRDEMSLLRVPEKRPEKFRRILENHVLMKMPNVLITPHNAFNTQEALERILQTTIGNIKAYKRGKPINLVNK